MAVALPAQKLLGRVAEVALLERLLGALPERGGALVVRGEAGIGKSALLDVARQGAARRGLSVLSTSGVQSEAHLVFAGLHHLLRPALGQLGRLPVRQREAVEAAFGLGGWAAPNTFLIALATLDLLAEMAADAPLVLIVEDAHWLDAATCDVLAFVARRIELEPIVMLFAVREGFDRRIADAGLPTVTLGGLDGDSAAALLDRTAPDLALDLRRRVLREAAGNPLALVELPRAADGSEDPALQLPLPLTKRLELAFAARAFTLPSVARAPLLVAALDPDGDLARVLEAASQLAGRPVGPGVFAPAVAADLVLVNESGVRFRHPLIRSAVYQEASLAERQAAHAALAAAYADDPDRRVWHHAASLVAPDDTVGVELEEAAARARRRGAPAGAAAALQRAAELTGEKARRGSLLVQAAELEFEIGRRDVAVRQLHAARSLVGEHRMRVRIAFLLEVVQGDWSGAEKVPSIVEIAEDLQAAGETAQALDALLIVAVRCWWSDPGQATRERVVSVAERLAAPDNPALIAILALADPVNRGRVVLDRLPDAGEKHSDDPFAMFHLGSAAAGVWAHNLSLPFLGRAIDGFRAQGRVGLLAQALVHQAWAAVHVADARVATPAAAEGRRLAEETGQLRWAAAAMLAQATMAAERGDLAGAEELTSAAEGVLLPMGANPMLALVQFARGRAAITQGRFTDAYEQLRRIFDPADIAHHPLLGGWAIADFVDAAVHGEGDLEIALNALGTYERIADVTRAPLLLAEVSYVRPLVASGSHAEALFQVALEDGETRNWSCYRGRLLLAYGLWLRRQRRLAESRVPLRVAAQTFDALGFVGMSDRSRQVLRAAGEATRPRIAEGWDQLSAQELQIARMAAQGMTNREIGEKLYLSHRTIGSHLYRIFPKLGITSRGQLRDALDVAVPS